MEFLEINSEEFVNLTDEVAIYIHDDDENISALDAQLGGLITNLREGGALEEKGKWLSVPMPSNCKAKRLWLTEASENERRDGAQLAASAKGQVTVWGAGDEFALGFGLRAYKFDYKTDEGTSPPQARFMMVNPEASRTAFLDDQARIEGVHLTRDLVNMPANILTTSAFAERIQELDALGVDVQILDEAELEKIGMRALLAVGQGSTAPSKVAIMRWANGKGDPLVLVGKGVVFDTGGISLKPAAGMEDMTMDMGGAGTVVGTMHSIAKRKAKANVIGIVGLVENMPSGDAQRPGDIVKSLKGDTIEVLNTDAEGRLVLADILWYAQEQFKPAAVIDLATLTGAIIVALGHENAGVFSNDDEFRDHLLAAANQEGEGAWPMPMGEGYDKLLKSRLADMGNIGGRWGGAITAAQFLKRFVQDDMPWIHLDIAGVAHRKDADDFSTAGASGWGVLTLDRLVANHYE